MMRVGKGLAASTAPWQAQSRRLSRTSVGLMSSATGLRLSLLSVRGGYYKENVQPTRPTSDYGTSVYHLGGANSAADTRISNGATSIGDKFTGSSRNCDPTSIRGGQDQSSASRNNGWATKEIGKGSQAICKNAEEKGNNLPPQKTTIPDEEWQIAEAIYDWWISGKSYEKWYSERFQQGKLNFNDNEND